MKKLAVVTCSILALVGTITLIGVGYGGVRHLIAEATLALNTNPPSYIKDIVAYKEGDGYVIYLTLADDRGALTSADGQITATIRDETWPVWTETYFVRRDHFRVTTVGYGAFERTTLLWSLGRISQQHFQLHPLRKTYGLTLEVVFFTTDGRQLKGSHNLWL
jgi:hypothetical protein